MAPTRNVRESASSLAVAPSPTMRTTSASIEAIARSTFAAAIPARTTSGPGARFAPSELVPRERFDDLDAALRSTAVRVAVGIEERHEAFGRLDGRVVFVLPDCGNHFAFADDELGLGQCRRHQDVGQQTEHRLEIFR